MTMLFIKPILSYSTYMDSEDSFDLSLRFLAAMNPKSESFRMTFKSFVENQS